MTSKQVDLTKNFFALGLMFWLYERIDGARRSTGSTTSSASGRSSAEANKRALKAGYAFGETTEMFHTHLPGPAGAPAARHVPQHHRQRGDRAGLRGRVADWPAGTLFYGSYPITPASDILHQLSTYKNFGVKTFQAEDEIAAIGARSGRATAARWA